MIGETLAHYKILEQIGQGGMGTVYRARDTKLDRDVALKFLPTDFAFDPERVARFEREAKTLASLNHANIASIYGFEEDGERRFLAMELVEGEDLSGRLKHGAIPRAEALDIARQMADGLEEAHERGIVHRDLKPANVRITHDGKAKVLDFGLARAYEGRGVSESDVSESPTITAMTQVGVILGTAAYMSPEQAKGKPVDRRADLWAFGVILWEMLTGNRLFDGEDASDTLAAVLRKDPPWDELPGDTPKPVRRLLERCLERDPRKRLRDIGETRVRLEQWTRDPDSLIKPVPVDSAAPGATRRPPLLPWALTVLAVAAAAFFALRSGSGDGDGASAHPAIVMDIRLPEGAELSTNSGVNLQLSPDGTQMAYRTLEGIRIRPLDQRESRLLDGTEGAVQFTFSPDGQWIAFLGNGKLRRVSTTGGAPSPICDAALVSRGIAWVDESTIVFAPNFFGGLHVVSLQTGELRELTTTDAASGERSHRWPVPMPDGRSVLFMCQYDGKEYDESDIRMVSLDGKMTTVYRGGAAARYAASGHLLFVKDNTVFALRFDPASGTAVGLGVPVLDGVWARVNDQEADDGSAQYFVSPQGMLVYRTQASSGSSRLAELDLATGQTRLLAGTPEPISLELSPDGSILAFSLADGGLQLMEAATGLASRFSFETGLERLGAFSPDGRVLYWSRTRPTGGVSVFSRPTDGSEPERNLFDQPTQAYPRDISPDGRAMAITFWNDGDDQWEIGMVELDRVEAGVSKWIGGPGAQVNPRFSPDGRWVAYQNTGNTTADILLRRYPDIGVQWEVVSEPGARVSFNWRADGTAIFVRSSRGIHRIPVDITGEIPRIGTPERLDVSWSIGPPQVGSRTCFSGDGAYAYLHDLSESGQAEDRLVLVTEWFSELERLAPR